MLKMVYREPGRYLPAALAVAFSAVLVSVQAGMLLGFLIHRAGRLAAFRRTYGSVRDLERWAIATPSSSGGTAALPRNPRSSAVEPYLYGVSMWHRDDGGLEQCYLVGTQLDDDSVGLLRDLQPQQRVRLAEPGAVALYDPDRKLLGLSHGIGTIGEINGTRVEVVAILSGPIKSAGLLPGLVCSLRTARRAAPGSGASTGELP